MAGPGTTFRGPLMAGDNWVYDPFHNAPADVGLAVLSQIFTVPYSSPTWTFSLPAGSVMLRAEAAVITAITGATAVAVDLGTAASGTQLGTLASAGLTVSANQALTLTAAAVNPVTYTLGQTLYGTLAFTGTATAGVVQVVVEYVQTLQPFVGEE